MMKFKSLFLLFSVFFFLISCSHTHRLTRLEPTKIDNLKLRKIGAGDQRLALLNAIILDPEAGIDATILQTSHNYAEGKVVRFQPATGETEYLDLPHSSGAWAGVRVGDDVYLGGHLPGDFFHLKITDSQIVRFEIPRPDSEKFEFVWNTDVGSDGMIYLGTYPDCMLLRFNPANQSFENLGVMVENEQYIRHVNGKFEGKIFCGVGSHAQIVEYDLATGNKTPFLPEQYQQRSFVYYSDRFKDLLYAVVTPDPVILFFDPATHQLLREVHPPKPDQDFGLFNYESIVDVGDDLYFGARPDDDLYAYNYDRDETRLIARGIGAPYGLARDRYLFCRNYFGTYSIFDLQEQKIILQRDTKFEGAGMDIFALAEGVNGTVVGGAYINQGFFSYDPLEDKLTPFGASVQFGGQIRQLVAFKNKIFIAHYTHARLTEYDPNQPWNPGNQSDSNPHLIGAVGHEQDRFPAAYLAEDDKIYFGTQPEYGVLGGTLTIFDPQTKQFDVRRNVVQDQSIFALTGNRNGSIFGGTAIAGGLGAHPTQKDAKIFTWDLAKKEKLMERTIIPDAAEIWDLAWIPENKLVGAADSFLFVYDIAKDTVEATRNVHADVIMNVLLSQDGWCYGNSEELLFRFSTDLSRFEEIDRRPSPPQFGRGLIETNDGRMYLGIGAELYELIRVK